MLKIIIIILAVTFLGMHKSDLVCSADWHYREGRHSRTDHGLYRTSIKYI
jgi:hypothetical protein